MQPSDVREAKPSTIQCFHGKREEFRKQIAREKRAQIFKRGRMEYFRFGFGKNPQNACQRIDGTVSNRLSNRANNQSPQPRQSPSAIQRSSQRRQAISAQLSNNITAFEIKPEPSQYKPVLYVEKEQPVGNSSQIINVQENGQNFHQEQNFAQNVVQTQVIPQHPLVNSPSSRVSYNSPNSRNQSFQNSQNEDYVHINLQSQQFASINPQCYQNSLIGFPNQQYGQINPPFPQNQQFMNSQYAQNSNYFSGYQQNIQPSPSFQQNINMISQNQDLIQMNLHNFQPQIHMSSPQNIQVGSPQISQNVSPLMPGNQLLQTPPRSQQPLVVISQNPSPSLLAVSPTNHMNISFGIPASSQSPSVDQNLSLMNVSFSNQMIVQGQINPQFQSKSPPSNQLNVLSPTLLSNERILREPHFVNPYVALLEEAIQKNSPKRMEFELNSEVKFQQKFQPVQEYFNIEAELQNSGISPFSKHKKNPSETYSALKIAKENIIKHEFGPQHYQDILQKTKKPQEPPKSTGKKPESQQKVEKKDNPEKPKCQDPIKKPQPKIQEKPSRKIGLVDSLMYKHTVLKMYKHYTVFDKVLGKGSFATVYLGASTVTKNLVAVKKMKIKRVKQMFEVDYLKEINHKNVIALYDYLMEENTKNCYLFLEYCDENLRERLELFKREKWSDQRELKARMSYIEQMIEGMNALNEKGFLHRDLKFENLLVKDGVLKIGDFGLCRKMNQKLQLQSIRCGTPYTMAPQIYFHPKDADNNPIYTEKSDIYSLAVIFHELIYNLHPFDYEEKYLRKFQRIDTTQKDQLIDRVCKQLNLQVNWIRAIVNKGLKPLEERLTWDELMHIYRNKNGYIDVSQDSLKVKAQSNIEKQQNEKIQTKVQPVDVPEIPKKFDEKKEKELLNDPKIPILEISKIKQYDVSYGAVSVFEQQKKRIHESQRKKEENQRISLTVKKARQNVHSKKISFEEDYKSFCDMQTEVSYLQKKKQVLQDSTASKPQMESSIFKNDSIVVKQDVSKNMIKIAMGILFVCLLIIVFERFYLREPVSLKA